MSLEEGYDFTQFNLQELQKKKHTITMYAYWVEYDVNKQHLDEGHQPLHVTIPLDCDGAPIPTSVSKSGSSVFAQICPGAEWSFPHYTNFNKMGVLSKAPGMIQDKRSWIDIIRGCCPEKGK